MESMNNKRFTLQCPMPELDFEIVTLGHGSGGKLTNDLLDKGVFSLFTNDALQQRHDGAFLNLEGKMAFTTDSFVVSPIFFPGGNIGELAVNGTVNDLAMCGATPKYISLGLIIEEGLKMDDLWEVLAGVKISAEKVNAQIVTGDTKVVERGKGDMIFINTTGIGIVHEDVDFSMNRIKPGDVIIISGNMAAHGMAIMSVREGLTFESDILSDTRPLNGLVDALMNEFGVNIKLLRDPTRGGVATVLNEITKFSNMSIELDEKHFPVERQVKAACEMLGMDPLYVANEGIFIAVVDEEIAEPVVSLLNQFEYGRKAAVIGKVQSSNPGKVFIKSSIGGHRVIGMLAGEQLPRIC
jgi:hydrogenase expression/formation protein HypE